MLFHYTVCSEISNNNNLIVEVLPLVEFHLDPSITDEEAIGLLGSRPAQSGKARKGSSAKSRGRWKEELSENNVQVLHFDEPDELSSLMGQYASESGQNGSGDKAQLSHEVMGKLQLRSLEPTEVIICKWPPPLRYKFYKNILPEMSISTCHKCFQVYSLCYKVIML
jgi:intraflagellar transport protein 122